MLSFYIYGQYEKDILKLLPEESDKILLVLAEHKALNQGELARLSSLSIKEINHATKILKELGLIKERKNGLPTYSLNIPVLTIDELDDTISIIDRSLQPLLLEFRRVKLDDIKDLQNKLLVSKISKNNLVFIMLYYVLHQFAIEFLCSKGLISNPIRTEYGSYYLVGIESEKISFENFKIWQRTKHFGSVKFMSYGEHYRKLSLADYYNASLLDKYSKQVEKLFLDIYENGGETEVGNYENALLALLDVLEYVQIRGNRVYMVSPLITTSELLKIKKFSENFIGTMEKSINMIFKEARTVFDNSKLKDIGISEKEFNVLVWFLFLGLFFEKLMEESLIDVMNSLDEKKYAKWVELS